MNFAIIPAGGKSVRMGRPKLALPLGGTTILGLVIEALRQAEIDHILVVVGPHVAELAPLAEQSGAEAVVLDRETLDMRATVEQGLRWLEDRYRPQPDDCWLLAPGDHPTIDSAVVRELVRASLVSRDRSIFVPTFEGRRGHPTLIRWSNVAGIRAFPAALGLNAYLRDHLDQTREVPVPAADILCDLDTPRDYELLREKLEKE